MWRDNPCEKSATICQSLQQTRAGLPQIPFHDLRRTHTTQLRREGTHPKAVSERRGHSKIWVTLDLHSQVMPGMQEEAARCVVRKNRHAVGTGAEPCVREMLADRESLAARSGRRPWRLGP